MSPTRPKLREDLIFRQVEEDFVVYDPVTDITALLNVSAAAMLDMCDGTRTPDEISAEIAFAFGVDKERITRVVQRALSDMAAQGFFGSGRDD